MKDIFKGIKLLALDVDGVLTDGTITINSDGTDSRSFNTLDGVGIVLWRKAGLDIAIISGGKSNAVVQRAKQLKIHYVYQKCHNKLEQLQKLLSQICSISPQEVVYIGDDLSDLDSIRYVGFGVAVANAVDEVKIHADYVTACPGGKGAVREVIEYILKKSGKWNMLVEPYKPVK